MKLADRCAAVATSLVKVDAASRNANQRAAVEIRAREWNTRRSELEGVQKRISLVGLKSSDIPAAANTVNHLRSLAVEAAARLAESGDVSTLPNDDLWTRLLTTAEGVQEALSNAGQEAWRSLVSSIGTVEVPHEVRARLPMTTPPNAEVFAQYEAQHAVYSRIANQKLPTSADDTQTLRDAVATMRLLYGRLQFDVPEDVEAFFRAVNSGGAGLELLTDVVRNWLEKSGQIGRFLIKKSMGS